VKKISRKGKLHLLKKMSQQTQQVARFDYFIQKITYI